MQTVTFRGYSDDIIYVTDARGTNEYHAQFPHDGGPYAGSFVVGEMLVSALYSPNGSACWSFAVGPIGEGVPLPDYPVKFALDKKKGYSVILTIECPDDERAFFMKE